MTIIDKQNEFSDAQVVTATAISTNVMDLGATNTLKNLGMPGVPLYLVIGVIAAVTQTGSGTVTFSLESDSAADLATSATVHWTSGAIAKATLVAGYRVVCLPLPVAKTYERYLGVRYTVSETLLTGSFDAFLTTDPQAWSAYADSL